MLDGLRQLVLMTLFDLAEGTANVVSIDDQSSISIHPANGPYTGTFWSRKGNQKLLVTHSPYIVQRFEPSDVIAVNRDGVCHQIPNERLSAVEKERINWWSPRLIEVLTARYVVVVEGLTDRVIVERAAELAGSALIISGGCLRHRRRPRISPRLPLNRFRRVQRAATRLGGRGKRKRQCGMAPSAESPPASSARRYLSLPRTSRPKIYTAFGGPAAAQGLIDGGYCKKEDILKSAGAAELSAVTAEAAAAYCRAGKVGAATALASQLDVATAANITSVNALLQRLVSLDSAS